MTGTVAEYINSGGNPACLSGALVKFNPDDALNGMIEEYSINGGLILAKVSYQNGTIKVAKGSNLYLIELGSDV